MIQVLLGNLSLILQSYTYSKLKFGSRLYQHFHLIKHATEKSDIHNKYSVFNIYLFFFSVALFSHRHVSELLTHVTTAIL